MEVGKLYKTKQFYWMLYRSEDDADISRCAVEGANAALAQFWSARRQNLPCIPPNSLFVVLEQKWKRCKVLSVEGNVGWIYLADWYRDDIEEVLFREAE